MGVCFRPPWPKVKTAVGNSALLCGPRRREISPCDKGETVELMIARYRRLKSQIPDQQMNDANDRMVAQLERRSCLCILRQGEALCRDWRALLDILRIDLALTFIG